MKYGSIHILGEVWTIKEGTEAEFPGLTGVDGYTDTSIRTIIVDSMTNNTDPMAKSNLTDYKKTVLRHEIIHAFLYESGLEGNSSESKSWAMNEEMVDWIAIQSPKIFKIFKDLELM